MIQAHTNTRSPQHGVLGNGNGLKVRLFPNGECVVYKPRSFKLERFSKGPARHLVDYRMALFRLCCQCPDVAKKIGYALGLSSLPIFDRNSVDKSKAVDSNVSTDPGRARKGLNGITSQGARTVRNACYLMQRELGRARCVFATVTVPSLPVEQMWKLHENWHQVVERYRLNLRRLVERHGLRAEIVTVSEVQEKRYEDTGLPVLHLHSVFNGKTRSGQWCLTTEEHDDIWRRALNSVDGVSVEEVPSSCNLQRVKKSAESYLGKYMTKGSKVVRKLAGTKLEGWIPYHWWNCTRSLRSRIDQQTRFPHGLADWLEDSGASEGGGVWDYQRVFSVEYADGWTVPMARYGRLKPDIATKIRRALYSSEQAQTNVKTA